MPEDTPTTGRDRLRELLDAVLDEDNRTLTEMAGDAFASPWHFSRQVSRAAGEAPVALRRRVVLERAAWQLGHGRSVTDVAFAAGYGSVEGFSRAFTRAYGRTPGQPGTAPTRDAHWLPAPHGIHFHPPTSLWVAGPPGQRGGDEVTALLVHHDLEDTRVLLETATALPEEEYRRVRAPDLRVLEWDGPEESLAAVLEHQVWATEVWLASVEGADHPDRGPDDPASLLARRWLRAAGVDVDAGDPIDWLRRRTS